MLFTILGSWVLGASGATSEGLMLGITIWGVSSFLAGVFSILFGTFLNPSLPFNEQTANYAYASQVITQIGVLAFLDDMLGFYKDYYDASGKLTKTIKQKVSSARLTIDILMTLVSLDLLLNDPTSSKSPSNSVQWFVKSITSVIHGLMDFVRIKYIDVNNKLGVSLSYLISSGAYFVRYIFSVYSAQEANKERELEPNLYNSLNFSFAIFSTIESLIKASLYFILAFGIKNKVIKYISMVTYLFTGILGLIEMLTDLSALGQHYSLNS